MQFRLLGPMEVVDNGKVVGLGGTKQRATLGFLLLQANKVVATSQLLNALWSVDEAPMTARKILQNAVYGLRGVLSSGHDADGADGTGDTDGVSLLTQPPGYMLCVRPEQVDLHQFHTWVGQGRDSLAKGAPDTAAALLRDALDLWRGPALADLVEKGVQWPELTAVQNTRLDVLEDYFEARLACGRHHEVLAELETMVRAEPLRERSCGQLMLALYRCGRQADALAVFSRVRAVLVENLGLEPGRGLQRLQQAILTQDPELVLEGAPIRGAAHPAQDDTPAARPPQPPAAPAAPTGTTARTDAARAPRNTGTDTPAGTGTGTGTAAADRRGSSDRRRVSVVSVRTRIAPSPGSGADQDHDDLLDGAALLVREQIERFGGTVTASIGSISLGLFGLDDTGQDNARQAVRAALAIRDVFDVSAGTGSDTPPSAVHAMVTDGEVLLRRRGHGQAPTVVGAVLDECQTLLADVPAGEVRVSDAVREASESDVLYRGCDTPGAGWQALGVRATDTEGPGATEWTVELDVLRGLMRRTRHRAVPHLVTVLGEAGTGKSRLLGELSRWIAEQPDPPLVLTAHAPRGAEEFPLTVAGRILSSYCGVRPEDDEETAQAALEREVRALYASEETAQLRLRRLRPLVTTADVEIYGQLCPGEVLDAWREFMQEAAQRHSVVLCVDDLHLAPDTALDAVEELVESTGSGALFVVACARPELLARRPSWAGGKSHTTTVTLDRPERLTNEQLVEFLLSASRSEGTESFSG